MPDILLIQPPVRDLYLTAKRTIPYGLSSIAASLIQHGFSVQILDGTATSKFRVIDFPEEMADLRKYYGPKDLSPFALFSRFKHFGHSFQHIGRAAKESGAFLVGVSALFTPYIGEALRTAEAVKSHHPECKLVLGGHHPTVLPESVMGSRFIDFVLRGEGEISMPLLAKALKDGLPIRSVPGVVYRRPDGSVRVELPAIAASLEENPLPAIHLIDNSFYRRRKKGSAVVVAARGCPMTCSYCSVNARSCVAYRRRSVGSVVKEIEEAVRETDAGFIDFEDENLSLDRKWFLELLDAISMRFKDAGLELRAMNGLYPPSIDEGVIRSMKSAGFKTLNLSLGSCSKEQLRRFRRPDVVQAFEEALFLSERHGLDAVGYIIAGAPHQSAEDSVRDLLFLARRRVLAGISIFYPSPGSSDYTMCEKIGILPAGFSLMRSTAFPIDHTTSRVEAVTLLRLGRILNFMKLLRDEGIPFPEPASIRSNASSPKDRMETGKILLSGFFHDGKIRGVQPDGTVFEHVVSETLSGRFLDGIRRAPVRGSKGRQS